VGALTDFVVADRGDARRICDSHNPSQEFGGLDAKGIDTVKLGELHALLRGGEFDPAIHETICDGGAEGPWVFEVPPDLVQRLAGLTPAELEEVGRKWATAEVFSPRYDNWPAERVQQQLGDLAALCRQAAGEGKSVLMWMCL
jgi:hypothetical protein